MTATKGISRNNLPWSEKRAGVIHYFATHPHQPAGLIELSRHLAGKDRNRYSNEKMKNLRRRWMKYKLEETAGKLVCEICGKKNLTINSEDSFSRATLDHIIPISRCGVLWNNPFNFQIACFPCNSNKSSLSLTDFENQTSSQT